MNTDIHIQGYQRTNNTESLLAGRHNPTNRLALSEAMAPTGKLRPFQPGEMGIRWASWTVLGGLVARGLRSSGHGEKQRRKSTTTIGRRRIAGAHTHTHTYQARRHARRTPFLLSRQGQFLQPRSSRNAVSLPIPSLACFALPPPHCSSTVQTHILSADYTVLDISCSTPTKTGKLACPTTCDIHGEKTIRRHCVCARLYSVPRKRQPAVYTTKDGGKQAW